MDHKAILNAIADYKVIAARLGVHPSSVSRWKRDGIPPEYLARDLPHGTREAPTRDHAGTDPGGLPDLRRPPRASRNSNPSRCPDVAARARPFVLKAPIVREHPIQQQIASVLSIEIAPPGKISKVGVVWWSIDMANYAGEVPGVRIGRGIIAGIPDLFVLHLGYAHLIEVKAEDGELSDAQRSVMSAVMAGRGKVAVARNAWEVLDILDNWNIPRAKRVVVGA